jgi:predicted DNA-binding transcriptional regulator YafY
MVQTSARLLRLLLLLQGRRFWSGADLAERLEVTHRTLRRDVDRLRTLGYPVDSTSGMAGGYRLGVGGELPPLLLDDDEAVAVSVALRTAAGGTVTGMEEPALRALTKLEQVLPSRLRDRVAGLHAFIVPLANTGPTVDLKMLSVVASACRDHERLLFEYRRHDGVAADRTVEPSGLVHTGRRWYLVAWDAMRDDWRTFRVDRIVPPVKTSARFAPRDPPDGDLAGYVARSVSSILAPIRARLILHAPLEELAERVSPAVGALRAVDAQRCELEMGSHSLDSLAAWIAYLGIDFEVLEPIELVAHLRGLAERLSRATLPSGAETAGEVASA